MVMCSLPSTVIVLMLLFQMSPLVEPQLAPLDFAEIDEEEEDLESEEIVLQEELIMAVDTDPVPAEIVLNADGVIEEYHAPRLLASAPLPPPK